MRKNGLNIRGQLVCGAACLALSVATAARAQETQQFNIQPQAMSSALTAFGIQAKKRVIFSPQLATNRFSKGASGSLDTKEALTRVLAGSGLAYREDQGTILIVNADQPSTNRGRDSRGAAPGPNGEKPSSDKEDRDGRARGGATAAAVSELIVTAEKRSARLIDVPVPVTELSAPQLVRNQTVRLQDYFTSIPGFAVAPASKQSQTLLAIRGLSTGASNPTVGIMIDDIPYGSTTAVGGGNAPPDLDPNDLQSIEVLRGPQGTLYGAASIGGLLKFVTADPSPSGVSGRIQAGVEGVRNGSSTGYTVRGMINLPMSSDLAVRISAFTRDDPGYIDNPIIGRNGVNEERTHGVLASALWRPTDQISLKLSALYQNHHAEGVSSVDLLPGLTDLQQSYIPGTGQHSSSSQVYSAIFKAKAGPGEFTSLTGYSINNFHDTEDITYLFGTFSKAVFGFAGTPQIQDDQTKKFSEEVRYEAPLTDRLNLTVGGFYTRETSNFHIGIRAADTTTGQIKGVWTDTFFPSTYSEYAAFADLTYKFTDALDVQFGARASHIHQWAINNAVGIVYNSLFLGQRVDTITIGPVSTGATPVTYLLTPRWKITPNVMLYARFASGYRAGGVNIVLNVPQTYGPDKTQTYEAGLKGEFFDGKLVADLSAYYIDWNNIQLTVRSPNNGGTYIANAAQAKSQGVEVSLQWRPLDGLNVQAWGAANDAVLTRDLPSTSPLRGVSGNRLSLSPRLSGKLSIDQRFPLTDQIDGYVGGSVSYVGDRLGNLVSSGPRPSLPKYTRVDLHAGVDYETWSLSVFANNVGDERGILLRGADAGPPFTVNYIQPRTIGVLVSKSF